MEVVQNQRQSKDFEFQRKDFEAHFIRAKALKGLIELVNGNVDSGCAKVVLVHCCYL